MKAAIARRVPGRLLPALAAALTSLAPAPVRAGRSPFAWVHATEVVPERSVELETWILEENGVADSGQESDPAGDVPDLTALWWSTVLGITDRIEISLPIEIRHLQTGSTGGSTILYGYGAELRWRLVSPDPVEAGRFAPQLRAGVHRLINARNRTRSDAGFALGVDLAPRVHAAADIGATWIAGSGKPFFELTPAAGVGILVFDQLSVGAELIAEITLRGDETDWLAAGPSVAWTHGRFWIAAALPIGIIDIRTAPRVNWAVAF